MDAKSSLLFGTCRERNLIRLDPNVPDENYMFLVEQDNPISSGSVWSSFERDTSLLRMQDSGSLAITTPEGFRSVWSGGGVLSNLFGMKFTHPSSTSTGELYLRTQVWLPIVNTTPVWWSITDNPIVTIVDNVTGEVVLRLKWVWNGDHGDDRNKSYDIHLEYKDRLGAKHTLQGTYVFPDRRSSASGYRSVDIKVFLPKDGPAELMAYRIGYPDSVILSLKGTEGQGYYDSQPNQNLTINSMDGLTSTNSITRFIRIGVGNKISTARP